MEFDIKYALAVILAINVFFFLGQTAIDNINPTGERTQFFDENDAMIGGYNAGNYTLNEDVASELPNTEGAVSPETGNWFTDTFQTVKNWFLDTTGLSYLLNLVNALPHFLSAIGLPHKFVFAIGFFWHAFTIFLVVSYIGGKN